MRFRFLDLKFNEACFLTATFLGNRFGMCLVAHNSIVTQSIRIEEFGNVSANIPLIACSRNIRAHGWGEEAELFSLHARFRINETRKYFRISEQKLVISSLISALIFSASHGDCRRRIAAAAIDALRFALAVHRRFVFNLLLKPRPPLVIRERYQAAHLSQHSPSRCLLGALSSCAPLSSTAMRFGDDSLIHGTGGLLSQQTTLPVLFRERETCLRNPFDQPRASARRSERNARGSDGSR